VLNLRNKEKWKFNSILNNSHLINDFNSRAIIQNWFQCEGTLL
jgi:hypothetical protein